MPTRHFSPSPLGDNQGESKYDSLMVDSPSRNGTTQKSRSDRNRPLSILPVSVDIAILSKVPRIQRNLSNISESTGERTNEAFMAYEKYYENEQVGDDNSLGSEKSKVSFSSEDTFSTHAAKNKFQGPGICLASVDRYCTWRCDWAASIVKSRIFKRLSIILILINCTFCAVATADSVTEHRHRVAQFDVIKQIFVGIMTMELILQALGNGFRFFADGWLVFDLFVIGISWTYQNFVVMRTFRVVRTLR
jgi:hypothetical protein